MIEELIPTQWRQLLKNETCKKYFSTLDKFIESEYAHNTVYPEKYNIFHSISGLSPEDIKCVIIGQDPYHEPNQACGLSFSVTDTTPPPKSLVNIYKELKDDVGVTHENGNLDCWKKQGVLLLNTVLTVREHEANSHKDKGWEHLTAAILNIVLNQPQKKAFILWGNQAKNVFQSVYNGQKNVLVLYSAHPSPLSAYRGFFGSKPFSKTNQYLTSFGIKGVEW